MDQIFTTLPGPALDLAGPGRHHPRLVDDVRHIVLSRQLGDALRLDPDDLVQTVCCKLLRLNRPRPVPSSRGPAWCYGNAAYDPERASLSRYVVQVTSGVIADLLEQLNHRESHELRSDPTREDHEIAAPEPDPLDAPLSLADAPSDPDDREAFFSALCCLEVLGELPCAVPLWQRALEQRRAEVQGSLFSVAQMVGEESVFLAEERAHIERTVRSLAATTREPAAQLALF